VDCGVQAKGGTPPWSLGGCIGTQIKAEKVVEDEIKEGAEGERTHILICEVEQVRGRGVLG
jgi:hypothetical protein